VIHQYIDNDRIDELEEAAPQLVYVLLTGFIGPDRAAETALSSPWLASPAAAVSDS
jgi:hypothetical protein